MSKSALQAAIDEADDDMDQDLKEARDAEARDHAVEDILTREQEERAKRHAAWSADLMVACLEDEARYEAGQEEYWNSLPIQEPVGGFETYTESYSHPVRHGDLPEV